MSSSLNADFNEVIERIKRGREFGQASFEPIYYLVFSPSDILAVKRQMKAWEARLTNDGWIVHKFSIADAIREIFESTPSIIKNAWHKQDAQAPQQWQKTNAALANRLEKGTLQSKLEDLLTELEQEPNAILLVTDLEALHPYIRIGSIEGQLQGKFSVPTVFFYPGVRTGKTRLKFLGFYPEDGNYRSEHVGG
ncbi:protein of unknown function [Marinobacter salarius]|jgi:hypothetical protein|uniref:DUF1788 domain-containing protein n=1 Tax=Marinobacter salarius TaxID=1420917 RepID=A0ABY1FMI4_9GAMM|nr:MULTISPECIES: BREX protein BrxB domain-containing protein [Marinobacter]KXJ43611.1 MAG: hypothetical protein AXW11_17325 [Marinobacter sp. Hex_13]SFL63620.1 protein of unknown function [Marinobacter salarius]